MKLMHRPEINFVRGYIALISVIILSVVGMIIASTLYLIGIEGIQSSDLLIKSSQAKALANACAEVGIGKVIIKPDTTETGNLTLGNGFCNFSIINGVDSSKYVSSTASVDGNTRKVFVNLDPTKSNSNHTVKIFFWQEVP